MDWDAPLMTPAEPIEVEVLHDDGQWYRGFCTAWRDVRVSVRYSTSPGYQYLRWLPADEVRRVE